MILTREQISNILTDHFRRVGEINGTQELRLGGVFFGNPEDHLEFEEDDISIDLDFEGDSEDPNPKDEEDLGTASFVFVVKDV